MTLQDKLKRLVEIDKAAIIDQAKHEDSDGYFGFLTGSEWQHARLKPVLTALIECVDALEFYADRFNYADHEDSEVQEDSGSKAMGLLANLERVAEKMK